jgi:hypothetical protein
MSWVITPSFYGYITDADAKDYLSRVHAAEGQTLEPAVALAVEAFVVGCKADGIWPAIKASCILAGARTLAGALVPLVGSAPTNNNFVSGDYNRETGLVGNGSTKYLNSNRNNNADPQDNKHIAAWVSSAEAGLLAASYIGSGRASAGATNMGASAIAQNAFFSRVSCSTAALAVLARGHTGFAGLSRSSSTEYNRRLSPLTNAVSQASQALFNGNFYVFGENNNGVVSEPTNARLAFYSIGESLDLALLDARVTALINAFDAAI